jgi:predicted O-linked N-acetylglucosamine transferase (SPINDLY family)
LPSLASGAITFGNFDDPRKIAPEVIRAWAAILSSLPAARLLLVAAEFTDPGFADRFTRDLGSAGIDPAKVALRPAPGKPEELLSTYSEVDIALDTFPFNNDPVTTCEALWMGVPVVALTGDLSCSRQSSSVLAQVGLERLISETPNELVETAVQLAEDIDRLRTLRTGMRDRMRVSPLMDERGFARRFEAALRDMWRQWCRSSA